MDPVVLDVLDDVLDEYLSYSKKELEEHLDNSSISPFWKDVSSVIKISELFSFTLKDSFVISKPLEQFIIDNCTFKKLGVLVDFYTQCASNDEVFKNFEVAA